MRCFMVPRGVTVLAGGAATAESRSFSLGATTGSETMGVLQNPYLLGAAKTLHYSATITIGNDSFSYEETTVLQMNELAEPLNHTDRNTLRRIS